MPEGRIYNIFKKGSRTYFYNSLFFPKDVREEVFILYSFVREADNLVDEVPQDPRNLAAIRQTSLLDAIIKVESTAKRPIDFIANVQLHCTT